MAFEERPNSGVLFVNNKRGGNEKAPSMKGSGNIVIRGVTYDLDIAGWTRESPRAGKFLSLSIKVKTGDEQYDHSGGQAQGGDEDVPF
jgi:hypothetical protein